MPSAVTILALFPDTIVRGQAIVQRHCDGIAPADVISHFVCYFVYFFIREVRKAFFIGNIPNVFDVDGIHHGTIVE